MDMWDGASWMQQTDWCAYYRGLVGTLVKANSADFAKLKR